MNNNSNGAEKLNKISVSEINKSIKAVTTPPKTDPITVDTILKKIINKAEKYKWELLSKAKDQLDKVNILNKKIFIFFDEIGANVCEMARGYYIYTGTHWEHLDKDTLERFLYTILGELCKKGLINDNCKVKNFLFDEFRSSKEKMPKHINKKTTSKINLLNGTLSLQNGNMDFGKHNKEDFFKYVLPYEYNPKAECPKFMKFLNKVLPEPEAQKVLFEYLGRCFIPTSELSIEKVLFLYGTGANGKSVLFNIINALFGNCNVSKYALSMLAYDNMDGNNARLGIGDTILNYGSDEDFQKILNVGKFKQLASGEPVQGKNVYNNVVEVSEYAKLMFNCNNLPKQSNGNDHAYFRRLLIIPFEVTIPEAEQNKNLANEIINDSREMAGILNLIIEGLIRIYEQKGQFTESKLIKRVIAEYQKEADSVCLFIDEKGYKPTTDIMQHTASKDLYIAYKEFCNEEGYTAVGGKTFKERLEKLGIKRGKITGGNNNIFYCSLISEPVGEATEADQSNLPF